MWAIRSMGWPSLIVLHMLIPSNGPLIGYSKHTHKFYPNIHLTHNLAFNYHGIALSHHFVTSRHDISYHSSSI